MEERGFLGYLILSLLIISIVVVYVWQNVEVMKLKMECRRAIDVQHNLVKENDRLRYQIETLRTVENIDSFANSNGLRPISYDDLSVMRIK